MYQVACFGRGSTWIEDLKRLQIDWEREKIFQCNSILSLEILWNHSCNSPSLATLVSVTCASVSYRDFLSIVVQRIRQLAIPELSLMFSFRESFQSECLEFFS